MLERKMDYRGSKSNKGNALFVKEQRVDGSQHIYLTKFKIMCLRCTLMGFERNYQIRILSNQLNNVRFNSSMNKLETRFNINPWFLTGFADGEASFLVNIYKSSSHKSG